MSDLIIRVDASTQIGTGHLMRCLALAQAWRDRGGAVTFVCAELPESLAVRIRNEGFEPVLVADRPGSIPDAFQVIEQAQERQAQWVVVDGYHFGVDYHRALKNAGVKLLVLDDYSHVEHYVADLVLNQNVSAGAPLYCSREHDTRLLLGPRYTLLRREFRPWQAWKHPMYPAIQHILITLGGSDPDNVTAQVLQALQQVHLADARVTVLVGGGNPHYCELMSLMGDMPMPVSLLRNVIHMPDLMAQADLAISAAGSTCWELAYMGVPGLVLLIADNQQPVADQLRRHDAAVILGRHREVPPIELTGQIEELAQDIARRRSLSESGQALIDGAGADRVCAIMMGSPYVRPAVWEDAEVLWQWANDPSVRHNSFHPEPISFESHLQWYRSKLDSPNTRIWIAEEESKPIGQIRYDRSAASTAEIDFSVAPEYRGRGVGTDLLRQTWTLACRALDVEQVKGTVFASNPASIRAFEKAEFEPQTRINVDGRDCLTFVRKRQTPVVQQNEPNMGSKWT